jgi:hypothetical protein
LLDAKEVQPASHYWCSWALRLRAGYISVYPDGHSRPKTSYLNFDAGDTVPNLVVAPVAANGKVDFYSGLAGTAQILADLSGWIGDT